MNRCLRIPRPSWVDLPIGVDGPCLSRIWLLEMQLLFDRKLAIIRPNPAPVNKLRTKGWMTLEP